MSYIHDNMRCYFDVTLLYAAARRPTCLLLVSRLNCWQLEHTDNLLQLGISPERLDLVFHLSQKCTQYAAGILKRPSLVIEILDDMFLERNRRRAFLEHIYGVSYFPSEDVLRIWWFERSFLTPCTTGKLNFPSVRSSQKPLFWAYCDQLLSCMTHLIRLEVHVVVSNLEPHSDEVDEWDIVAVIR